MNFFSHMLFICSLVYLLNGIIILFMDRKAALNRAFFALNLCLFIWSFFTGVMTVAPDKASCVFFSDVASLGYCTFASISLHFFFIYADMTRILKKWWTYVILYLPAAVFIVQACRRDLFSVDFFHNQYGWIVITNEKSVWFWLFMLSIAISGMINLCLSYLKFKNAGSMREHKQSKILLVSATISFLLGMGLVTVTKIIVNANVPDLTVTTFLVLLLGILYAIIKYRLMILTPAVAADTILKTIIDPVLFVNPQGLITYTNAETLNLLGYKDDDVLGKPFQTLFPAEIQPEMETIVKTLAHGSIRNKDTVFVSQNNQRIPILFSASSCNDNAGDSLGFVALSRDISEYKRREEEIRFLSYHDQLTGLYNRRYYEEAVKSLDMESNLPIAIIMGDVNGLKMINDSIGHVMGDELLLKAAQAMIKACAANTVIARLGGDEFVILLPHTDLAQATQTIARINDLLKPERIGNLDISVSFGCEVKRVAHEKISDVFKAAEDHMYTYKNSNKKGLNRNTIDLIMNALYEKNHREMLHSKRVGELCEAIAIQMNFAADTVYRVKIAGLMHDIGKIGIADETLNKATPLNAEEWEEIKKHPEAGQRILSAVGELSEIGDYIFEHQEKWDGTGYPRGLKGEEILFQARIIAVADAYDAMTSHRNYGRVLSSEEAINEIRRCSGTQFDPAIARIFVEKVLGKAWDL